MPNLRSDLRFWGPTSGKIGAYDGSRIATNESDSLATHQELSERGVTSW